MNRAWMLAALAAICMAPTARSQAEPCAPDTLLQTISGQSGRDGRSVAISGNLAVVASHEINGIRVFNASSGSVQATISPPGGGRYLGDAVAISGNLAVAEILARVSPPFEGYVSIEARVFNAATGDLHSILTHPAPIESGGFGYAVAISGNLAVVGSPWYAAGTAFVFDATTGDLQTIVNNPEPQQDDYFGYSVAISGNLAVVGAVGDDEQVSAGGSAYVFNVVSGALQAKLYNPHPLTDDKFGSSVAISGNLAAVGSLIGGGPATAYVFDATTGALLSTLSNPSTPAFGSSISVAISGNLVVLGAPWSSSDGFFNAGAAYVLDATTGGLLATLKKPAPALGDEFGRSVAIFEGLAIVGAPGSADLGSAYIFGCPPVIVRQPTSMKVNVGQGAAFLVEASGPGPLAYQWFKGSEAIDGAMSAVYIIVDAAPGDAGAYHCEVTGAGGTTISNDATLTVFDPSAANDAQFGSHSSPSAVAAGQEILVGVVMKNISQLTWSNVQGYALEVIDDPGGLFQGVPRFYLSDSSQVIPASGGFAQYVALLRAPAAPGQYTARLRMAEENVELFGEEAVITIQSAEPVNAAPDWTAYE